ncbi:hypothetical protein IE53DRAFT_359874 [Violaceomyces palustris]|uniref:Uncharacterized protein n=1 Tax=Violaceomyces palustris TaxID=1673888 RepID=A0ACD0P626_9BASI|nr:hypothetical protein IE53DRAFT_359874 [Violaceomyces palustris]
MTIPASSFYQKARGKPLSNGTPSRFVSQSHSSTSSPSPSSLLVILQPHPICQGLDLKLETCEVLAKSTSTASKLVRGWCRHHLLDVEGWKVKKGKVGYEVDVDLAWTLVDIFSGDSGPLVLWITRHLDAFGFDGLDFPNESQVLKSAMTTGDKLGRSPTSLSTSSDLSSLSITPSSRHRGINASNALREPPAIASASPDSSHDGSRVRKKPSTMNDDASEGEPAVGRNKRRKRLVSEVESLIQVKQRILDAGDRFDPARKRNRPRYWMYCYSEDELDDYMFTEEDAKERDRVAEEEEERVRRRMRELVGRERGRSRIGRRSRSLSSERGDGGGIEREGGEGGGSQLVRGPFEGKASTVRGLQAIEAEDTKFAPEKEDQYNQGLAEQDRSLNDTLEQMIELIETRVVEPFREGLRDEIRNELRIALGKAQEGALEDAEESDEGRRPLDKEVGRTILAVMDEKALRLAEETASPCSQQNAHSMLPFEKISDDPTNESRTFSDNLGKSMHHTRRCTCMRSGCRNPREQQSAGKQNPRAGRALERRDGGGSHTSDYEPSMTDSKLYDAISNSKGALH